MRHDPTRVAVTVRPLSNSARRVRGLRSTLLQAAVAHDVAGDPEAAAAAVDAAARVSPEPGAELDADRILEVAAALEAGGSPVMAAILQRVASDGGFLHGSVR